MWGAWERKSFRTCAIEAWRFSSFVWVISGTVFPALETPGYDQVNLWGASLGHRFIFISRGLNAAESLMRHGYNSVWEYCSVAPSGLLYLPLSSHG